MMMDWYKRAVLLLATQKIHSYAESPPEDLISTILVDGIRTYSLPPTNISALKHGFCAYNVSTFLAESNDPTLTYDEIDTPFGDGVQLWSDKDFIAQDVKGRDLCEGGTYLRPSKYEVASKTNIQITAAVPGRGCITLCMFLHGNPNEWGEEWKTLVDPGRGRFTQSEFSFRWSNDADNYLYSFCGEIGSCSERYEIQPALTFCKEGRSICSNECHHAVMNSWVDPDDVLSSKVIERDNFDYPTPCGCSLYGNHGTKTLLTNFDISNSSCEPNILARPVCLRENQPVHNCSLSYIPGMYDKQAEDGGSDADTTRGQGSALFIGLVVMVQSLIFTNYIYVKSLRQQVDKEWRPIQILSNDQVTRAKGAVSDTMLFFFDPKKLSMERQKAEEARLRGKRLLWIVTIVQGLFLNQLRKDPNEEKEFIDWRPIPRKKGLINSCAFDFVVCYFKSKNIGTRNKGHALA